MRSYHDSLIRPTSGDKPDPVPDEGQSAYYQKMDTTRVRCLLAGGVLAALAIVTAPSALADPDDPGDPGNPIGPGIPMAPNDPACIAQPGNGVCAGGPYGLPGGMPGMPGGMPGMPGGIGDPGGGMGGF